jgi:cytochrome bd-type quinol oxidase subunit 2
MQLFYEIKVTRIIVETIRNLMKPLLNLTGVLFTIYYVFALIGMLFFGGKIKKNAKFITEDSGIPDTYHLMNFNDMCSSYMTLFALMVVNNWMVITAMYVAASADDGYNGKYARFYFGLFYYFAVIIGINITVAFIIDMYSSVERLDAERSKTLELLESEMKE